MRCRAGLSCVRPRRGRESMKDKGGKKDKQKEQKQHTDKKQHGGTT
jgi:hypothetical protein